MAYARAFLEEKNAKKYPDNQVKLLKEIFRYIDKNKSIRRSLKVGSMTWLIICKIVFAPCRQFAEACGQALDVNERLIKEDQLEYQEEMRAHYRDMLTELSGIMNEQVSLCNDQWVSRLVLLPHFFPYWLACHWEHHLFLCIILWDIFMCISFMFSPQFPRLLFQRFLSLQLHKSVLAASTSSLSNSSLSTLSKTGMSCHQIPSEKTSCHLATCLRHFIFSPFVSQTIQN